MNETVTDAVRELLARPSRESAVALLRAADSASEESRRSAISELDAHVRATPEQRSPDVAAALIALRRAGLAS